MRACDCSSYIVIKLRDITLLASVWGVLVAMSAKSLMAQDVSPLQTVMDGREEAASSTLTEEGVSGMTQGVVNSTLYICGTLAVILAASGLVQLYNAQEAQNMMGTNDDVKRAAYWKIAIAGLISIPAIIAAIVPFNVLNVIE